MCVLTSVAGYPAYLFCISVVKFDLLTFLSPSLLFLTSESRFDHILRTLFKTPRQKFLPMRICRKILIAFFIAVYTGFLLPKKKRFIPHNFLSMSTATILIFLIWQSTQLQIFFFFGTLPKSWMLPNHRFHFFLFHCYFFLQFDYIRSGIYVYKLGAISDVTNLLWQF